MHNNFLTESYSVCQFASRHQELFGDGPAITILKKETSHVSLLWEELEDSDEDNTIEDPTVGVPELSTKPWKQEFDQWMDSKERGIEGKDVMTWWGVSHENSFLLH